MILVVSYPDEDHSVDVIKRLEQLGREVRLMDLSDFPAGNNLTFSWKMGSEPDFSIGGGDGPIDLRSANVAWWRRVRSYAVDEAVSDPSLRAFAESETTQAIGGMLDSLPCVWVNPRAADEMAHRKPLQWTVAQRVGLRVPRTLVTNQPEKARNFINEIGSKNTVFKAFLAILEAWRETRKVQDDDLNQLDSVRFAPVIFQEYIEGVDLRVTIIGDSIFAAEIDARETTYPYDMRMVVGEATVRPVELPAKVNEALLQLQRKLGLLYGAIDMRRTARGEYFFFEVNPAGQWLFVEERTGLPISQTMADFLATLEDRQKRAGRIS